MSSTDALPPAPSPEQLPRRAEEAAAAAGEAPMRTDKEPQPFVLNVRGFLEVVGVTGPSLTISSVSPQVKHYGGQPSVTPPTRRTLPATGATVKAPAAAKPSAAAAAGARTTAAAKAPAAAVKPSPRAAQTPARVAAAAKTAATVAGEGEGKEGVLGRLQPATGRGTEDKTAETRPKVGVARVRASSEGNKKQETVTTQQQEGTGTRMTTGRGPGEKATLTEEAVGAKAEEKAAAAGKPLPKLLKKSPPVVQPKRVPTLVEAGAGESREQQEAATPKPQPKLVKKSPPATLPKTESAAEAGTGEKDGEKAAAPKPEPKLVKKPPPVTLKKVSATPAKAGDGKEGKETKDVGLEDREKEKGETAAKKNEKAADKEGAVPAGEEEKIKKAPTVVGSRKPTGEKKAALQASKPTSGEVKTEGQQQLHQEEKQEAGKPRAKAAPVFPAAKGVGKAPAAAVSPAENAEDGAGKAAREQAAKDEKADEASSLEGAAKDVKPSEATKKEEKDEKALVTKRSQSGPTVITKEGTAASKGGPVASAAKQALAKAVKETQSKEGLKPAVAVPSKTEASATTRKETSAEAATEGDKKLRGTPVWKAAAAEGGAAAVAKQEKKEGLAGLKKKGEAKDTSPEDTKKAGAGARAAKTAAIVAEKKVLKGEDAKQVPPPKLVATKKAAPAGAATVAPPGPPGLKNAKAAVLRKAKEEEGGDANRVGSPVGKKLKAAKKKEGESSTASSGSEGSKTGKKIARAAAGEKEAGTAGKKQKKAAPRKLVKKGETLKATVTGTKKPVPNLRKKASIRVAGASPTEHSSAEKGTQQRREEATPQQEEKKQLSPQEKLSQKQEEEKVQKHQDGRVQKQKEEEVNRQRERPKKRQKEEPRRQQEELQQKQQEEKFKEQQDRLVHHQKEELRQQQEGLLQQPKQREENLMQQWEPLQEQQRLKQNKAAKEKSVNEAGTLLADRPTDAQLQKKHEQVLGMELGRGAVSATEGDSAVVGTRERERVAALSSERQRQEQPPEPQGITVPSTMEKSLDEAEVSPLKIKEQVEEEAKREAEIEQSQRAESKMPQASPHSFFPFPSWCTTPPPAPSYNLRSKPWPSQDVLVQRLSPVQKRMEEHTAMMLQNHGVWLPPRKREKAATTDLSASSCANKSKALHYLGFCCCCQSCQTDLHSDRRSPASHTTAIGEIHHLPSGVTETPAVEYDTETQLPSTKIHVAAEGTLPHEQQQQIMEAVGQQQPTTINGWAEGSPYVSYQGYYDEAGNWISTPQGYYDETGNWVSTPATADVSASVEQNPQDAGDSYAQGHYIQGFYDESNNWVQGYYDETGNWVWVPTVQQTQ